jgi:nucleotide-binding universal stress UspA family protein
MDSRGQDHRPWPRAAAVGKMIRGARDRTGSAEMRGSSMASGFGSASQVVVGVDGSAESIGALKWAAEYAAATGATVLAVLSWHYPAAVGAAPIGVAPKAVSDEVRAHMEETLDKALSEAFGTSTPDNVKTKLDYGHPAQVLVEESRQADLLVVGHRGHGAFTGMLIGSVSIHCVTHAACPVVVVRGRA